MVLWSVISLFFSLFFFKFQNISCHISNGLYLVIFSFSFLNFWKVRDKYTYSSVRFERWTIPNVLLAASCCNNSKSNPTASWINLASASAPLHLLSLIRYVIYIFPHISLWTERRTTQLKCSAKWTKWIDGDHQ